MNKLTLGLSALGFALLITPAFADPLTYPGGGPAPTVNTYATGTSITLYFDGASASFTDYVEVYEVGVGQIGSEFFDNQTTQVGATETINGLTPGDQIVFEINSPDGNPLASDPAYSTDGENHAWIIPFSGNVDGTGGDNNGLNGYYVGFEDISPLSASDLDYNDETVVVTGVTTAPEPSSLALLGTSILGAAGLFRRRFVSR